MKLSLEQLTVWEASPPELIAIAEELGAQSVSVFVEAPAGFDIPFLLDRDNQLRRDTKLKVEETGVQIHNLEVYVMTAETDVNTFRPSLDSGAYLGAEGLSTVFFDPDANRSRDNYEQLCELAGEYGLKANIEFIAHSSLRTLAEAVNVVNRVNCPNAGINIDALHLVRSGGNPSDIAKVDHKLINYAQICDGPATTTPDMAMHEGFNERMLPGTGEFPLCDFLIALPQDISLGVEVPMKSKQDAGVSARERAMMAMNATRGLLEKTISMGLA